MAFRNFITVSILLWSILAIAQHSENKLDTTTGVNNFFRVNDSVYRSAQPSKKEFKTLELNGLRSVLNLRKNKNDSAKARGTTLLLEHQPLKTKMIDQQDIIAALRYLKNAEKPVLVHCWHGSDRTGVTVAAYRIVFEDWSKEDAIAEMRDGYGYHEKWYPNLIVLLQDLDVNYVKDAVQKR